MVNAAKTLRSLIRHHKAYKCIVFINIISAWALLGILDVDRMEDEGFYVFFRKREPTLQVIFRNPYLSDPYGEENAYSKRMDANGDWLSETREFEDYTKYCKTRYRIMSIKNPEDRKKCREQDRIHWKTDERYQVPVLLLLIRH